MSKRVFLFLFSALAIGILLAACGGAPVAPTAKPAATTAPGAAAKPTVPHPAPKSGSTPTAHNADFDKDVADVAKALGLTNYVYEAYQLLANTKWDDVFAYYNGEMTKAGWSGQGQVMDIDNGKVGAYVNKDTHTGLAIFFLASPDGSKPAFTLAIFGQ